MRIEALFDRHSERRTSLAETCGIRSVFEGCTQLLSSGNVDFLKVCSRSCSHEELVALTIENNVPVLCQKPFLQIGQDSGGLGYFFSC